MTQPWVKPRQCGVTKRHAARLNDPTWTSGLGVHRSTKVSPWMAAQGSIQSAELINPIRMGEPSLAKRMCSERGPSPHFRVLYRLSG